jgi:hypothetical protein
VGNHPRCLDPPVSTGLAVLLIACVLPTIGAAEVVSGRVTFLGTFGEERLPDGSLRARLRFRLSESTCGTSSDMADRWFHVWSGRMDAAQQGSSVNFRNAYSTLLSGFLGPHSCQGRRRGRAELQRDTGADHEYR